MAAKKMTVKTLGEDLDVIKEVKEIHTLTLIIEDLRAEVNQLKNKEIHSEVEQDEARTSKETFKCRKCDQVYKSKKNPRIHISEKHPARIECTICDTTFKRTCDLDFHIKNAHEKQKEFECEICGKAFVTEWRLTLSDMGEGLN